MSTTISPPRPAPVVPADITARRRQDRPIPTRRRTGRAGGLVVACILDEFSYTAFSGEADLAPLTMKNWRVELTAAQPDLLLVESAWRGHRQKWWNTVHHHGPELTGIVEWCRERGIPTAFWNKEDPVHFNTFLTTAGMFDAVFTTDLDCVPRYKKELRHENVHFLPFAAQPAESNPAETFERVEGCAFAGAFYEKYPERLADLAELSRELSRDGRRFDIYDRNQGSDMPGYMFPAEYQNQIVGGALTPDMLDIPYKGYTANLNLNSVKQSQSMFARRVFEVMASNTVVISNFSRGLRLMFGDLAITTDSGSEVRRRLEALECQPHGIERLRAMALRKVLAEHTYADRLSFIAEKAGSDLTSAESEIVGLIASVGSSEAARSVIDTVKSQRFADIRCVLIGIDLVQTDPRILTAASVEDALNQLRGAGCTAVGALAPTDHYGPNYVLDLVHTLRWADVPAAGHSEFYEASPGAESVLSRRNHGASYTLQPSLALSRSLLRLDSLDAWTNSGSDPLVLDATGPGFSVGVTEYCRRGKGLADEQLAPCRELPIDTGMPLEALRAFADGQRMEQTTDHDLPVLDLAPHVGSLHPAKNLTVEEDSEGHVLIVSTLAAGQHTYAVFQRDFPVDTLPQCEVPTVYLDAPPGLEFMLVIYYFNGAGKRISHDFVRPRVNNTLTIPAESVQVRFGLRVSGPGEALIKAIFLEHFKVPHQPLLTRSRTLVATNVYPSYDNLYRNGFVHSRTRSYLESGERSDVLRVGRHSDTSFSEFEDIDTAWIDSETFDKTLAEGVADRVLVHFLDRGIWDAVRKYPDLGQVTVWVHGAEVQPWWRRQYNYTTPEELEAAKPASDERLAFWREVFNEIPDNLHFVFVSQYFADEVFEDVGIALDQSRYTVIHNPIDTDIFTYSPKPRAQNRKVLTIRPYASAKYANDLSVAAILELKDRPGFGEIDFRIIGDGALFDEILNPLRDLPNVKIERGFLTHSEIAAIHKEYGIFLTPTRMDAQGVSRDEAMSSGLVPITSAVAAIPEFVDEECGFLAPSEDHIGLAEAIWAIAQDGNLFERLSKAAARRVREQTASSVILPLELSLIFGDTAGSH